MKTPFFESTYLRDRIEEQPPQFLEWIWKTQRFDFCCRDTDDPFRAFEKAFEVARKPEYQNHDIFYYDYIKNEILIRLFWVGNETEIIEFLWDSARRDKIKLTD